jgi:exosortase A-associated hydrolase 1
LDKGLRRIVALPCEGETLLATLDGPEDARIGWIFVVGGRQTRVGPHRLYERLAARLSETRQAVIRFERRGVGDSSGIDLGYLDSGADAAAALAALKDNFPDISQVLGFGLCDGASAIALVLPRLSGAVLANPWVVDPVDDLPPAAAIRGHYRQRLRDPQAWMRLLRGGVDLGKLWRGLRRSGRRDDDSLARRVADGLPPKTRIVLADGDGTAQAFAAAWRRLKDKPAAEIVSIPTASHSFANPPAFEALARTLIDYSAATASSASKSASAR